MARRGGDVLVNGLDPILLLQRITEQALELGHATEGVLLGLSDGRSITYVCAAGYLEGRIGTQTDLHSSIGGASILTASILQSDDTETDARVDREVCRRVGTRSTVCVPLIRDGEVFGVLAVGARRPNAFSPADVAELAAMAEIISVAGGIAGDLARIGTALSAQPDRNDSTLATGGVSSGTAGRFLMNVLNPEAARLVDARERIRRVLDDPSLLDIVFQPILDLASDEVVAFEALSRFALGPARPPDEWFNEAHRTGLGVELEMLAVDTALSLLPRLHPSVLLTVNAGPETAVTERFQRAVTAPEVAERVVLELTEHSEVDDYPGLAEALHGLRCRGVRLAVDDTGAGFASLAHILKLAPDIIKLDRELITGIDVDPVRRALAEALVAFADRSGAKILAEGVERGDELLVVRELGISYAQGFYIGRPAPIEAVAPTPVG